MKLINLQTLVAKIVRNIASQTLQILVIFVLRAKIVTIFEPMDVRGPYVTPELNNELQFNVGNIWEKNLPCIYMH